MVNEKNIALKICGMRDPENIMQIAAMGPQYMGFIFYPGSPRFVGDEFSLPPTLPQSIKRVGVFVNESNAVILSKAKMVGFDVVQLHGSESLAQTSELKSFGLTTIKVFSVDNDFDFELTKPYKKTVDYFLFDTKGKYYGGNATTFSWDLLSAYDQEVPFFLSGGLSPENILEVDKLKGMNIYALDLNSGVETSPGKKNPEKIQTIITHLQTLNTLNLNT